MRLRFFSRDLRRNDPATYPLYWCTHCEFGRLGGTFTAQTVAPFYELDGYYTHSVRISNKTRNFLEQIRFHLAWRVDYGTPFNPLELGDPSGRSVCDIGCGNGGKSLGIQRAGFKVTGVEPDQKARQACQIKNVFEGTAERLPAELSNTKFDIVFMSHVLEHCTDPMRAITNVKSLLASRGTIVIEVPNNAAAAFGPRWAWTDIPRHLNFFTARSLAELLRLHGVDVKRQLYHGYCRQIDIAQSWFLLACTAFATPARKYDSIRVHGQLA
jgi:2-polyprenyl-3-methyl-5-hydroxy-6-metoxy-1,4-benzoquinol methylase